MWFGKVLLLGVLMALTMCGVTLTAQELQLGSALSSKLFTCEHCVHRALLKSLCDIYYS